jgi:ATP-dependent Zn protease
LDLPTWRRKRKGEDDNKCLEDYWAGNMPKQLKEIYDFLRFPDVYENLGVDMPKGVILFGKPGTGKTHFARIIAKLSSSNFYYISASAFDELYVGRGSQRVRNLFKEAGKSSTKSIWESVYEFFFGKKIEVRPTKSVIFIDEIDALGVRDSVNNRASQTLSQLLTCMDGLDEHSDILVIAATNNLSDVDPALRRSGRFDRICKMPEPDKKSRYAMINHLLKGKLGYDDLIQEGKVVELVEKTKGFSYADLKNLSNEIIYSVARDTIINFEKGDVFEELLPIEIKHFNEAYYTIKSKIDIEIDEGTNMYYHLKKKYKSNHNGN